ncbi:MAG: TolC family protein [Proteobacteria bacterium]|nr:TolC family protein [Pseudomonadota bacterium]MBU4295742.1 TolC family protein [Pseudomonadota bacterium]MCG2747161.1 TolC family protein [Desulfobulbaceae bacterium]
MEIPSEPLTLEQCIKIALTNSPKLQVAEYEVKKAEDDVKITTGRFLPSISASARYDDLRSVAAQGPSNSDYLENRTRVFRLAATQPLFAGFSIFSTWQKAKLYKEIAEIRRQFITASHILDIRTSFLKLLKSKEDVRNYTEAVVRLEEDLKAAQARYERHFIPHVDLLSTEVELADIRQVLSQAVNQTNAIRVHLNVLLGLPPSQDIYYTGNLSDFSIDASLSLDECTRIALDKRPELTLLEKQVEIALKDKKIAKYKFAPRVDLSAAYNQYKTDYKFDLFSFTGPYSPDQKNDYWTVGVTMNWDLFQGGSKYYEYSKTLHEITRLKEELDEQKNFIYAEVKGYYLDLKEAEGRIDVTRKTIKLAKENFYSAQKRYMISLGTQLEVLKAHEQLIKAEVNVNQSMNDYQIAMAMLKFATGGWYPLGGSSSETYLTSGLY